MAAILILSTKGKHDQTASLEDFVAAVIEVAFHSGYEKFIILSLKMKVFKINNFISIVSIIIILFLLSVQYKAVLKGKEDAQLFKSEQEIIKLELESIEKNSRGMPEEEIIKREFNLGKKSRLLYIKYPPFYHTINKCSNIFIYQLLLIVLAIGVHFSKSKKSSISKNDENI